MQPGRFSAQAGDPTWRSRAGLGHSLQGRPSGKSGHVRRAAESGSKLKALVAPLRAIRFDRGPLERDSTPETGASCYELSEHEWTAIKSMLPNKPRGVRRVNDRRVLNGIF